MTLINLENKIALVTGATEGIGRAITEKLLEEGMRVICIARTKEKLDSLKQKHGDRVHIVQLDVTDQDAVMKLPATLPPEWQGVYAIVNNAGMGMPARPFDRSDPEDMAKVMAVNFMGPALISKAFLRGMKKQRDGHIINIGSVSGDEPFVRTHVYGASKAALESLSDNIRIENGKYGVRVSLLKFGITQTDFAKKILGDLAEKVGDLGASRPHLQPSDIAGAVAYCLKQPKAVSIDSMTINPTDTTFQTAEERMASVGAANI